MDKTEKTEKTIQVELNALELFYVCDVLEHAIKQFQREGETVEYDKKFLERLQAIYNENFVDKKQ